MMMVVVVVVMTRMMLTTRVGRWEEGKGGKEASRVSLFPPSHRTQCAFVFLPPPPSLPTTQKGVLATTTATIAKTSLLK